MAVTADEDATGVRKGETGWRALFASGRAAVTVTLAAGVTLHAVNVYLATTIMPSVIDEVGGARLYAWATTVFMFASVVGSTAAGALLAARGARGSYRVAGSVLLVATVICALAPSMPVLLVGRFAQGLGGGLLFALSYSMVRITYEESLWPRAMALVAAMWGIATFVGPALGGAFAELGEWRLAFWALVPVVLFFAVWGAGRLPPTSGAATVPRIPWVGVGLLAAAVAVVSAASISTRIAVNLVGVAVALLLLFAWFARERGAKPRLIPAATFGPDPRLRLVYLMMVLLVVASTVEVFVPYFGQRLQGMGPLAAGYLGAVLSAGWTVGSLAFSGAVRRRGLVITVAPAFVLAGLVLLVFVGPVQADGAALIVAIGVGLFLVGWGIGMAWPHLLTMVLLFVPDEEQDTAGSSVTTIQLTAIAFGAAVAGAIANVAGFSDTADIGGTIDAARWLFAVFAVAPLIALVAARRVRA